MTSLYAMLFDDDEFEKPNSLVFPWNPMVFGMRDEIFKYSNRSLQEAILKEFEAKKWMEVCCERNLVFVVCNQSPVLLVSLISGGV